MGISTGIWIQSLGPSVPGGLLFRIHSGDESPTDMVRKPSNLSNMVSPLDGGGPGRDRWCQQVKLTDEVTSEKLKKMGVNEELCRLVSRIYRIFRFFVWNVMNWPDGNDSIIRAVVIAHSALQRWWGRPCPSNLPMILERVYTDVKQLQNIWVVYEYLCTISISRPTMERNHWKIASFI